MYSTLVSVALFALPALASFAINNPESVQCETTRISWPPTTGPYNLIVVDANEPCGEPLAEIGDFTTTYVDWEVAIPAGTVIQYSVADAEDTEAWSANITVSGGSNRSCLPGGASSSAAPRPTGASATNSLTGNDSNTNSGNSGSAPPKASGIAPVGAANAGKNALFDSDSAAPRQFSQPVMALGAVAALVALAL
ncbi:hypothetical protein CC1G_14400 [Coprinopsis cinerea okayama7|uniref:Uncharacterized protein n=1 Tax=Coprinopsis cinerea (strain Okayama-7 / 130 / ATCC MYA-4618 / FGSC 9003) TaxID=240176 RepID=D6RM96_COPC7|nr:hypothetical protein CC1G_14400 [Coprinopsis cinerea okayama7\|eukprot:XP_002911403.1 hypothetical protein CC1G_14400 [Coprinopsis cinerea okayama7\